MIFGAKSMDLENWGIRSNEVKKMIEGKSKHLLINKIINIKYIILK